jgi:hypothetical protein
MKEDLKKVLKITLTILLPILIIYVSLLIYFQPSPKYSCDDLDVLMGMKYDACFYAKNSSLIFSLGKFANNDNIGAIKIQFLNKEVRINNPPLFGKTNNYKFSLDQMPENITVSQYLRKGDTVCTNSRFITLEPCSEDFNPTVDFISASEIKTINFSSAKAGDIIPSDRVNPSASFNLTCLSMWECKEWEQCTNGIQKRICEDKNSCLISTNIPQTEKSCSGCAENWKCSWSECKNGNSTPTCSDTNNCGTYFSVPRPVKCREECTPNIECTDWGECHANYSVNNLRELNAITGIKTRICSDKMGCMNDKIEQESCSVLESVYSKEVLICGVRYLEIYTSRNNELVARIKNDQKDGLPEIGLSFDSSQIDCDSCSNSLKDAGELGIDCGGICKPCRRESYSSDPVSAFLEWLRTLLRIR